MSKKTSLYEISKSKFKARFVDFGDWNMPLSYSSVIEEHMAVRNQVGVFDVSHMGKFILQGKDAFLTVNFLITNDLAKLSSGGAIYTPLLYENGTFVDDIIVYFHRRDCFYVVVNAANIQKDYAWMQGIISHQGWDVELKNVSEENSLIAINGRKSKSLLSKLFSQHDETRSFSFSLQQYQGREVMVANTGYTGESGVEVWCDNQIASDLFERVVSLGATPCGLGARDSLRLEKGYSLYGHEITDKTNVWEAGLGWTVNLNKSDFMGKTALEKIKTEGVKRKLIGMVMEKRAIPRKDYLVFDCDSTDKQEIGVVTSGGYSPCLKKNIGLAYVFKDFCGQRLYIDVRGHLVPAEVHKRVFW